MHCTYNDITYVRRLLRSEKGRRMLQSPLPASNAIRVTVGHIRAIREIMSTTPQLFTAAWKIKVVMDNYRDHLAELKLTTIRRIMKVFCGARYKKADTRPPSPSPMSS
jgi:hypothetical protein